MLGVLSNAVGDLLAVIHEQALALQPERGRAIQKRKQIRRTALNVRDLGVRGLIAFVKETIANPWIDAETLQKIATGTCQIRLE